MENLHRRQQGITITGLVIGLVIVIFIALLGFKLIPSFLEFRAMKGAVNAIARERQGGSVADIRRAWDTRGAIDDYTSVKATDLEITKNGNQVVISFAYRKEVPLFTGVGLYIDYAASSAAE